MLTFPALCDLCLRTLHRTAVFADGSAPVSAGKENGPKSGAMLDSLIQGLIYERQTGNYLHLFLQKSGNKVLSSVTPLQGFFFFLHHSIKWNRHLHWLFLTEIRFSLIADVDELPCLLEISSRIQCIFLRWLTKSVFAVEKGTGVWFGAMLLFL